MASARLPLGEETYDRVAITLDYFLGTASKFADAATLDAVQEIISSDASDPVALHRIDWELAPFYCPDYDLNYCRTDWNIFPILMRASTTAPSGSAPTAIATRLTTKNS